MHSTEDDYGLLGSLRAGCAPFRILKWGERRINCLSYWNNGMLGPVHARFLKKDIDEVKFRGCTTTLFTFVDMQVIKHFYWLLAQYPTDLVFLSVSLTDMSSNNRNSLSQEGLWRTCFAANLPKMLPATIFLPDNPENREFFSLFSSHRFIYVPDDSCIRLKRADAAE
jgi:hypothetical protein